MDDVVHLDFLQQEWIKLKRVMGKGQTRLWAKMMTTSEKKKGGLNEEQKMVCERTS
jgi:hypothetical protein